MNEELKQLSYKTPAGKSITLWTTGTGNEAGVIHEVITTDTYRFIAWKDHSVEYMVNLGAHIGTADLMAHSVWPDVEIHAYEANPVFACRTRQNTLPYSRLVCFNNMVVGPLYIPDPANYKWDANTRASVIKTHRALTMKAILARLPRVDLLKMDVEGAEGNLIYEMKALGVLPSIPRIVGEWHWEAQKQAVKDVIGKTHNIEIVETGNWNLFWATLK